MWLIFLETFLGGMETTAPELGRDAQARLETFLGGMETRSRIGTFAALAGLETFLGGMETPHSEREVCEGTTP